MSSSAYSDCEVGLNTCWQWNHHLGSKRRCLLSTKKLHLHQMFMSSFLPWQSESEYYFLFLDVASTIVYMYLPCLLWTQFVVCHSEAVSCICVLSLYILKSQLQILKGFGHHFDLPQRFGLFNLVTLIIAARRLSSLTSSGFWRTRYTVIILSWF